MSWAVQEGGDWWLCRNQERSTQGASLRQRGSSPQHCRVTIFLTECYPVPNFSEPKMGGSGIYLDEQWTFVLTIKVKGWLL